jgi:hypothetical protein
MDADKLQVVPKTDEPAAVAPALLARLSDLEDYMISDPYPDFRGWKVVLPEGGRVGKVSDLIVDTNEMIVKYVEVKVDDDVLVPTDAVGADSGATYLLVPVGVAHLGDHEDVVVVDRLPTAGIEGAPRFERGVPTPEQERQIRDYYQPDTRGGPEVRMGHRRKRTTGPQNHAEGQHGERTHARFIEQLHEAPPEEPVEERVERKRKKAAYQGKRRLVEDRQQHDEAEKNSERTRLFEEYQRGRDDGPSDNRGNLHGVLGHREHRADYKLRGPDGLKAKE